MPNDETLVHPEQPHFLFPSWVWAVALFVSFGAIVAVTFGAMHRGSTYEEERAKTRTEKLKTAREDWNKTANTYGWIDKTKGVAHIPIVALTANAMVEDKQAYIEAGMNDHVSKPVEPRELAGAIARVLTTEAAR